MPGRRQGSSASDGRHRNGSVSCFDRRNQCGRRLIWTKIPGPAGPPHRSEHRRFGRRDWACRRGTSSPPASRSPRANAASKSAVRHGRRPQRPPQRPGTASHVQWKRAFRPARRSVDEGSPQGKKRGHENATRNQAGLIPSHQHKLRPCRRRIAISSVSSGCRPRSISRASITKSPPGERIGVPPPRSPSTWR